MHNDQWRQQLRDFAEFLQQKYDVSDKELRQELISEQIPAGTYNCENTPLQTTILYLQNSEYTVSEIAEALGRSPAEIRQALNNADADIGAATGPKISSAVFADRALSASEHLVEQLEEQGLSVDEMAELLGKAAQTIYTLRRRIREKRGEKQ